MYALLVLGILAGVAATAAVCYVTFLMMRWVVRLVFNLLLAPFGKKW